MTKISEITVTDTKPASTTLLELETSVGTSEKVVLSNLLHDLSPQGFARNYKIVPSVTSSNLTVALKTIAGTDPSADDPVTIRIGDTDRQVTAPLSVTKNAATNWCNSGSNELATNEMDYFVYLGYNATDGVVIGFARFPYAFRYANFSVTSTNEKYCAISTITNAAATDYYEVIGRFAATLSATASFNWSVPAYTALNLINRPIYETRVLSWTANLANASVSSQGGALTTITAVCTYQFAGNKVFFGLAVTLTNVGTGTGYLKVFLPFNPSVKHIINGGDATTGKSLVGGINTGTPAFVNITLYDATTDLVNTCIPTISSWYFGG